VAVTVTVTVTVTVENAGELSGIRRAQGEGRLSTHCGRLGEIDDDWL